MALGVKVRSTAALKCLLRFLFCSKLNVSQILRAPSGIPVSGFPSIRCVRCVEQLSSFFVVMFLGFAFHVF